MNKQSVQQSAINPLTPTSDLYVTSPNNIHQTHTEITQTHQLEVIMI